MDILVKIGKFFKDIRTVRSILNNDFLIGYRTADGADFKISFSDLIKGISNNQNLGTVLLAGNNANGIRIQNLGQPSANNDADTLIARNNAIIAAIDALKGGVPIEGDTLNKLYTTLINSLAKVQEIICNGTENWNSAPFTFPNLTGTKNILHNLVDESGQVQFVLPKCSADGTIITLDLSTLPHTAGIRYSFVYTSGLGGASENIVKHVTVDTRDEMVAIATGVVPLLIKVNNWEDEGLETSLYLWFPPDSSTNDGFFTIAAYRPDEQF